MNNTNNRASETINPWQAITENCSQLLPLSSAVVFAAHEYSKTELLEEQADLESQSFELNTEMLSAVAGLKALEKRENYKPVSFIQLLQNLRTRGKPDGTQ